MKLDNSIFIDQRFFEVMRKVNNSDKLAPKTAYKFSRLVRELDTHFQTYNGKRLELVSEYGTPDPEREGVSMVQGENKDVFVEKFTELANEEFRVTAKSKFTLPEDIEGITPSDFPIIEMIFDLSDWSDEDEEDDEESEE